jgi:hypothetical protein
MSDTTRVTHLFDCAEVGSALVTEGRRQNQPWHQIQGPWTRRGTQKAYYRFVAELALRYPRTGLWHVHMGGRALWARGRFARPYVLTLHGTDIRENYWQAEHHEKIKQDIDLAKHVFYTTPDLKEKAEKARPDAEYLPVALDMGVIPEWAPASRPRVFFPSRWDGSKGGDGLLAMAAEIAHAVEGRAELVGLDWGDRAAEAASLGIRLIPRMSQTDFLSELSQAHVAVGQTGGALGVSELQAMAIGVPLIFSDPVAGYPKGNDMGAIVVARKDAGSAVVDALADPESTSAKVGGPAYVRRHHDPAGMIDRLRTVYASASKASPSKGKA